jgi:hypothetical protein
MIYLQNKVFITPILMLAYYAKSILKKDYH